MGEMFWKVVWLWVLFAIVLVAIWLAGDDVV